MLLMEQDMQKLEPQRILVGQYDLKILMPHDALLLLVLLLCSQCWEMPYALGLCPRWRLSFSSVCTAASDVLAGSLMIRPLLIVMSVSPA